MIYNFLIEIFSWIFYASVAIGFILYFVSFLFSHMPAFVKYGILIRIISMILICFGIYFIGALTNKEMYDKQLKDAEDEIVKLNEEIPTLNKKIIDLELKEPIIQTKERIKVITSEVPIYINDGNDCNIPRKAIELHNQAVEASK